LAEIMEKDKERIALIQEWYGYCVTSDTSRQKFFVAEGEGGNGKKVLFDTLAALVGENNVSHVPMELFGERFQLTPTLGKLVNIASEIGKIDDGAEGVLKAFTSGDRMYFDRKGVPGVQARPTARLVFATNNLPRFQDRSEGINRRIILLPCRVTIPLEQQDPHLAEKMHEELPGIFNWALEGLRRLRRQRRFTEPALSLKAHADHRLDSNPARLFLTEHYTADANLTAACEDVYGTFRDWCLDNGFTALDSRAFGKEVARAFPTAIRVKRGKRTARRWEYTGIGPRRAAFSLVPHVSHVSHVPIPGSIAKGRSRKRKE
jgi:putative DNA primase/helicase